MPACPAQKVEHSWSKGCPAASRWVFRLNTLSLFVQHYLTPTLHNRAPVEYVDSWLWFRWDPTVQEGMHDRSSQTGQPSVSCIYDCFISFYERNCLCLNIFICFYREWHWFAKQPKSRIWGTTDLIFHTFSWEFWKRGGFESVNVIQRGRVLYHLH